MTITQTDERTGLAKRLLGVLEVGDGADAIFAPDCFFDLNVPAWRLQVLGPDAFVEWWHQEVDRKGRVGTVRRYDTTTGFVLETEISFEHHGHDLFARQIFACEVRDGRIVETTLYCTGDWDPETRARHAAEAPMLRP